MYANYANYPPPLAAERVEKLLKPGIRSGRFLALAGPKAVPLSRPALNTT